MRYQLASSSWDHQEKEAIDRVVASGMHSMGQEVAQFEAAFAECFGSKYAVMVNSGSSANLLAVSALTNTKTPALQPGDEVLVPAVSWGTTYYPFTQHGMDLRFVDIDPKTLNIDPKLLQSALTPRTKAVCAVNLLGNPCELKLLQEFCEANDLILIEDNCESMGALLDGKQCGTFGTLGTFSLYFSHHLCTIEGGVVVTDDEELYHVMLSLRSHGWTRHLPQHNHVENKSGDDFYDAFRFVLPGYNIRPCEINGALGLEQLKKLPQVIRQRRENAAKFVEAFQHIPHVRLQQETGESSWFGFSLVLEEPLKNRRQEVIQLLSKNSIECRPIVAGNFTRHPVIERLPHSVHGDLKNADEVHDCGFFVGNHPHSLSLEIDHLASVWRNALAGLSV